LAEGGLIMTMILDLYRSPTGQTARGGCIDEVATRGLRFLPAVEWPARECGEGIFGVSPQGSNGNHGEARGYGGLPENNSFRNSPRRRLVIQPCCAMKQEVMDALAAERSLLQFHRSVDSG
jgi:hypothetical protein